MVGGVAADRNDVLSKTVRQMKTIFMEGKVGRGVAREGV
jgi:hypothetical protein